MKFPRQSKDKKEDLGRAEAEQFGNITIEQWRKPSPISPIFTVFRVVFVGGIISLVNFGKEFLDQGINGKEIEYFWDNLLTYLNYILLGILGIVILASIYTYIAWKYTCFAVTPEIVIFEQGILSRKSRHVRINNIQAVDVVRPFWAALFGLAFVRVESAGGAESKVEIKFINISACVAIRQEILENIQIFTVGIPNTVETNTTETKEVIEYLKTGSMQSPEERISDSNSHKSSAKATDSGASKREKIRRIVTLDAQDEQGVVIAKPSNYPILARAILRPMKLLGIVFAGVMGVLASYQAGNNNFLSLAIPFLGLLITVCTSIWKEVQGSWNLSLRVTRFGIRLRRGLTTSQTQTIRPERVTAVRISQTSMQRVFNWWTLEAVIAGYEDKFKDADDINSAKQVLLSSSPEKEILDVLWIIIPDLAVKDEIGLLHAGLNGSGPTPGFISASRASRFLYWFSWRRKAIAFTPTVTLIRDGWISRSIYILQNGRVQDLLYKSGPVSRKLKLADLWFSLPSSNKNAIIRGIDFYQSQQVIKQSMDVARNMRKGEDLKVWYKRMEQVFSVELN